MNNRLKWILVFMSIFLLILSLGSILINGKPLSDSSNTISWIGFALAFCILMVLLYCLNIKVGIVYTLILFLLLSGIIGWNKLKHSEKDNQIIGEGSKNEQQLDENGNIILPHPYDTFISLQWGSSSHVDMDLMLVMQSNNTTINFNTPQYIVDDLNSVWLDYDYKAQQNIAMKEIVSILGMKEEVFSIMAVKYNEEELKHDITIVISSLEEELMEYTLPAERFNDETNGIHVCDMIMQTNDIIEIMDDFNFTNNKNDFTTEGEVLYEN